MEFSIWYLKDQINPERACAEYHVHIPHRSSKNLVCISDDTPPDLFSPKGYPGRAWYPNGPGTQSVQGSWNLGLCLELRLFSIQNCSSLQSLDCAKIEPSRCPALWPTQSSSSCSNGNVSRAYPETAKLFNLF